ncbi:SSS sodium solute transporter superfamily [Gloeocapsa sp. PCC 7428]|uniref:sodium:solute symporter n=1 Tax=Gloeocapsa sp. PCC 7428 TaxID=1173026 RepID=UPI0002A5C769|nr:sodium:solute symporter [Gloeocapsa sp. PCC 7428]AFZ28721.1 SSS sodium solute transporter superfamily [Gloeocapsa sp. PCC 7428]
MSGLDIFFLVAYFVAVGAIGYWSSRTSLESSKSYFLGGGGIGWMAIGASLFASNISAEHFIGLAGTGASSGLAVGQFEWIACFMLLLLGWLFVPFYLRTGVFTMPEFLEKRFNSQCRTYLSTVSLIAYIFTKISVAVYAGALVLQTILGWNIWLGAIVLIVATGAYTVFGGLRAVIYTDFLQAFILIGGGIFLTAIAITDVGGFGPFIERAEPEFFNLWKAVNHPEFPWTGILFGAPILGLWYWCTDQMIVQRTLAAPDIENARRSTIFAGFLKLLPVFILVLPGIAGRELFPDVAPNQMYATMVNELLPSGIKGLVVAGLLAALMSSLSSVFNSSSTLVVMDFYKRWRPDASERELVRAGQLSTIVLVISGLLWLPFIGLMSDQLYVYLQSVQAYISPPIAAVFLVGILWKRANGRGAINALIAGFILGAIRFVAELGTRAGWITWRPLVAYANINFLHFAILLFVISVFILVLVSLTSAAPSQKHLSMFLTPEQKVNKALGSAKVHRQNVIYSASLAAIVLVFWVIFSPVVF